MGNVSLKNLGDFAVRLTVAAAVSCILLSSLPAAEHAAAAVTQVTDIPPEGLGSALETFARNRKLQLIYATDDVESRHTDGAMGNLSTADALKRLLKGTGLSYQFLDDRTVTVEPILPSSPSLQTGNDTEDLAGNSGSRRENLRLAQSTVGPTVVGNPSGTSPRSSSGADQLEEVLVTAQKKTERLQDVPIPVTVLNANDLAETSQVLIRDFYASVPGLTLSPNFAGQQMLSIRGITTGGFTNPVVGVLVDDVPYGTSTLYAGNQVPDIDPGDLARIEVLRGPQGALYGSNSMGGLLKFVTIDPSTDGYSGRIEAGTSDVYNGAEPGYNMRASVNVPLGETLALRASAFTRQDPGYIDNPVFNSKGVNETEAYGSRLASLWRPADDFSLKLTALYQDTKAKGSSDVNVPTAGFPQTDGLGDLQQNYINGIGGYERRIQAYSAVMDAKLGGINLTSATGYGINTYTASLDFSSIFGPSVQKAYGIPGLGSAYIDHDNITKFSQELRLSGSLWRNLEWLVGGFYTHENAPGHEIFTAQVPATGEAIGIYWTLPAPTTFEEEAIFANVTYHFTDQFDVQLGGRESRDTVAELESIYTGPYIGPTPEINPEFESRTDAFTYLVTPRFKISPDLMVYVRLASGYRPGGPNSSAAVGVPRQYNPDKTDDYELGMKADFLNQMLSVDASIYYIKWKDIQIQRTEEVTFETNGSGAKSEGVELSVTSKPLTGLTAAAWIDYDNAVLTQNFPAGPAYGVAGDRLPNTSKWSGNLSLEQDFPLWSSATGFVGGQVSYVGDRVSVFTSDSQRQEFPSYTKTDLRAGVKYDSWTTNIYVNNVADVRGVLNGGIGFDPQFAYVYIQPRAVGVSVSKHF